MEGSFIQQFFIFFFLSLGISEIFVTGYENNSRLVANELKAGEEAESDFKLITQHPNPANLTHPMILGRNKDDNLFEYRPLVSIPKSHFKYWFQGQRSSSLTDLNSGQITHYYKIISYNFEVNSRIRTCLGEFQNYTCVEFVKEFYDVSDIRKGIEFTFPAAKCGVTEENSYYKIHLNEHCSSKKHINWMIGVLFGLLVETLRPDRDSHITINYQNLLTNPKFLMKWDPYYLSTFGVPYDYTSMIHLPGQYQSKDGSITVATKDIWYQGLVGRTYEHLSHRNKIRANAYRGCLVLWLSKCELQTDPCQNEGYTTNDCQCVCRPGTSGSLCQDVIHKDYYGSIMPTCSRIITQDTTILAPISHIDKETQGTWCVYKIFAPKGELITLTFTKFKLGKIKDSCSQSFLEIREKGETFGKMYCGTDIKPKQEIISLRNEIFLYLDVKDIDNDQYIEIEIKIPEKNVTTTTSTTTTTPKGSDITYPSNRITFPSYVYDNDPNRGMSLNAQYGVIQNYLLILEAIFIFFFFFRS